MTPSVRTTNFDAIAAAAPLDRTASVIRDGSGDLWEPSIPETFKRWFAPPVMKPRAWLLARSAVAAQLLDRRFGRLVVLGVLDEPGKTEKAAWVVRCDCSYYETRKAKTLLAGKATCCLVCYKVETLRATPSAGTTATRRRERFDLDRLAARERARKAARS